MERTIGVIGLNYKSAPVAIREKVSFSEQQITLFIRALKQIEPVAGVVVLSTCNRVEIYFHTKAVSVHQGFEIVLHQLFEFKSLNSTVLEHFYFFNGKEAVNHLFQVASGLNSMILGEDQIIGQVKNAFLLSSHEHCAGPVLTRLFNLSFNAGKQVRTETKINEGSASVSSAAASLAKQLCPDIESRSILLIGAGQTGKLSLMSLIEKGCQNLFITNRTFERAVEIANEFNVKALPINKISECLLTCDIVMLATGSPEPLIGLTMIEEVMPARNYRPMVILDLSVPRNVAAEVGRVENVTLFDVDDTEAVIQDTFKKRQTEIARAKEIVSCLADEYMEWLASLSLTPTIRQIQDNFRKINDNEFEHYRKFKNGIDCKISREYGNHISDKFSRLIIENLKQLTDNGKKVELLNLLNELFELKIADEK